MLQTFQYKNHALETTFSLRSQTTAEDWAMQKGKDLLHDLVFASSSGLWFAAVKCKTGISLQNPEIPLFFSDSVYQTLLHLQILETLHCSFNLYEAHLSSHWLWTFYKPVELPAWWLSNSNSKTFRESLSFHQIQCANIFRFWER